MFYIGSNVADWPLEAQRALADGHEICARKCPFFLSLSTLTSPQTLGLIIIVRSLCSSLLVSIYIRYSDRPHKYAGLCRTIL